MERAPLRLELRSLRWWLLPVLAWSLFALLISLLLASGQLATRSSDRFQLFQFFVLSHKSERVDLAASRDPAVLALRSRLGLRTTHTYAYLRYVGPSDKLPRSLATAFKRPETRGVTMGPFIAIRQSGAWCDSLGLAQVRSHELVHAYVDSLTRYNNLFASFPRWFKEGVAIYLSQSGGSIRSNHCVKEDSQEYADYDFAFKYLAKTHGPDVVDTKIRESVRSRSVTPLLALASVSSYDQLLHEARTQVNGTLK